ncbi:DcrB-related protein, partial [Yersinia pseudotuberculosis]
MPENNINTYCIQEGTLECPEGFTDRTVNLFMKGKPGAAFALNIARDVPEAHEVLSDYVQRQIGILKDNLKKYEVKKHQQIDVGAQHIPGEYVEATYMAETRRVW